MFWNDPNLYGASFPYKDVNPQASTPFAGPVMPPWQQVPTMPTPFAGPVMPPWQQLQRFLPTYGFTPYNYPVNPYLFHNPTFNPFFNIAPTPYNLYRPFII